MSDQTNRVTLAEPIVKRFRQADGTEREESIAEVTVRKPVAGDLRVLDSATGEIGKAFALAARLTGLDVKDVDKLAMEDFASISAIIEGFMPPGLQIGQTSSAT